MTMTVDALRAAVADGSIDTVAVACTDLYGRLIGKRFDAGFFCETISAGTHACDYLFTVDMEMEPVPGYTFASWQEGYGDVHLVPDMATLRPAAWADSTAIVLCDVHVGAADDLAAVAPRTILRRQLDRLRDHGIVAEVASELEFYIFDETFRAASDRGHAALTPSGSYIEDYHLLSTGRVEPFIRDARRTLNASGIPIENSKGEWGRGQHELNIRHADVLTMADRHTVMKHALKEVADSHGRSITFMAKPTSDEAGSSSHLHLSLRDAETGENVTAGGATSSGRGPDLFRWFLAGWMAHVDDLMVCYAPTVNSYKRYVDGSWAPTRVAWSTDNRTAGFRVVGSGQDHRIENRIPGADCNPYLAYAATIASGLAGIEQRREPPDEFVGDVYQAQQLPRVAASLEHATEAFDASEMARSAFGDDVVDHYARFHRVEVAAHAAAVSDWERTRYFERI